ncbi:MAG: hypothetical protein ACRCZI_04695 [Cetobacterium sp.]
MKIDFGININDKLYLGIGIKDVIFNIAFNDHNIILYDDISINVEETYKKSQDGSYSIEELGSDMFAQPYYSFTLTDTINKLSVKRNCEQMSMTLFKKDSHNTFTQYFIDDDIAKEIYHYIIYFIEIYKRISVTKTERVILEPEGSWFIYNCRKRYIYSDINSWNNFESCYDSDRIDTPLLK